MYQPSQASNVNQQAGTEQNVQIGVWGGTGCGKTTYLAALQIASLHEPGNWLIRGLDHLYPGSIRFLGQSTISLNKDLEFPVASSTQQQYGYNIVGTPVNDTWRRIANRLSGKQEDLSFTLNVLDQPGGDYLNTDYENNLWRFLAECDGIIYLYDPTIEQQGMTNWEYLTMSLGYAALAVQRSQRGNRLESGRMPQFLAVCMVKYDDPLIFKELLRENLIVVDATGKRAVPRVTDPRRAFDLKTDGLSGDLLRSYFIPERVRYFATSSIGFYTTDPQRIDLTDCYNVDGMAPSGQAIRGPIHPVDVFAPLIWLAQSAIQLRMQRGGR